MEIIELKEKLQALLGREVEAEQTKSGKWICPYIDYMLPDPTRLLADTEEVAYHNLFEYLQTKTKQETHDGNARADRPAGAGTNPRP